jgi:large subunit ribosomal protein L13
MLPKNRLRAKRLERLFIFPDAEHPYEQNLMKDHVAEQVKVEPVVVEAEVKV